MRKFTSAAIATLSSILIAGPSFGAAAAMSADLERIMSWWNGDYDNAEQIGRLRKQGEAVWAADGSGEGGHIEVTSHYRTVSLPAFGDNVIYVEETKHGDPSAMFRQRIYTLSIDESIAAIRVKLWNFKDKEKYVGAFRDADRLSTLTPEEMSPLPDNCDLIVERQGDKFYMPMRNRLCAFGDRYFNYQVLLGENSFWFRDKIVRLSDDVILQAAGDFTYHELERLR